MVRLADGDAFSLPVENDSVDVAAQNCLFNIFEESDLRRALLLDPEQYGLEKPILLESLEVAAFKDPVPADGACVFTGRTAIYFGSDDTFHDGAGHILARDVPASVCDKTARNLRNLGRRDLLVTSSTWFYDGGGCC